MHIFIQMIGFVGLLFFFISYQLKTNKLLFFMQGLGCLTFSLQFALLGTYSGAVNLFISSLRNFMLIRFKESKIIRWKGWIFILCGISILTVILTWNGPLGILPAVGTISTTIGYWTNNAKKLRIINLFVNCPCSLIFDLIVKSWGGVLNETITIISILISIFRFGLKALDGDEIK